MSDETARNEKLFAECEAVMEEIYARCCENAPNFQVPADTFKDSLKRTVRKYLFAASAAPPTVAEVKATLGEIQAHDLFMAIACANGSERAWWEFDQEYRGYLERVARHLARSESSALDAVDTVYVELYGTRVVDGERVSKFATYSGRGTLRGWLRTVVWHSLVDLHRASHDEISLDEMTENIGEGQAHANFAEPMRGGEDEMLDYVTRERYREATVAALEKAFAELGGHEKLLLLYYHVENLKLREIARLVEIPGSPLRHWIQRKSSPRGNNFNARTHESTIMRWLAKTYAKILKTFRDELIERLNLSDAEIEICMELATQDLGNSSLYRNLMTTETPNLTV